MPKTDISSTKRSNFLNSENQFRQQTVFHDVGKNTKNIIDRDTQIYSRFVKLTRKFSNQSSPLKVRCKFPKLMNELENRINQCKCLWQSVMNVFCISTLEHVWYRIPQINKLSLHNHFWFVDNKKIQWAECQF